MLKLETVPATWYFNDKCVISAPEYIINFPSPNSFLGRKKVQIRPITTTFKVYVDSDLEQQNFTGWLTNDLCVSQGYFTIDIKVIGRDAKYLFRKIPDFVFDTLGRFFTFDVEVYTEWELPDGVGADFLYDGTYKYDGTYTANGKVD